MNSHIYGFGYNTAGQINSSSQEVINKCVNLNHLQTLPTIKSIECGGGTTMYLTESRQVYSFGAIGGRSGNILQFPEDEDMAQVSLGEEHVLFLTENNRVYAQGWNIWGQLGVKKIDRNTDTPQLLDMFEDKDISLVKAGPYCSFVVVGHTQLYGWGHNNLGQIGLGNKNDKVTEPTLCVFADEKEHQIAKIECGYNHTLLRTIDGKLYGSGTNFYGQLGRGSCTQFQPIQTDSGKKCIDVACGFEHSIILLEDFTVHVTGKNNFGQLGLPDVKQVKFFTQLSLYNISRVCTGYHFSLFVAKNGSIWSCGNNELGSLGIGSKSNSVTPQHVEFPVDKSKKQMKSIDIACGAQHTIVLQQENSFVHLEKEMYRTMLDSKYQLELEVKSMKKIIEDYESAIHLMKEAEERKKVEIECIIEYEDNKSLHHVVPDDFIEDFMKQLLKEIDLPVTSFTDYDFLYWDEKYKMYLKLTKTKNLPLLLRIAIRPKLAVAPLFQQKTSNFTTSGQLDQSKVSEYWELDYSNLHIKLDDHLTSDATGIIYKGNLSVNVKRIDLTRGGITKEYLQKQISLYTPLNHDHLLKVIGIRFNDQEEEADIATEYCPYQLQKYLRLDVKKMTTLHKLKLCMEMSEALYYLHTHGLIHQSLSLETFLITTDGHVKLSPSPHFVSGHLSFIDKLIYFSPEYHQKVYMNQENIAVDHRTDIYAFGVLVWQIFSGVTPYQDLLQMYQQRAMSLLKKIHDFDAPLRPDVEALSAFPDVLATFCTSCWDASPEKRYQNFSEVSEALQSMVETFTAFDKLKQSTVLIEEDMPNDSVLPENMNASQKVQYSILVSYEDRKIRINTTVQSLQHLCEMCLTALAIESSEMDHYRFQYYDRDFEQNVDLDSLINMPSKLIVILTKK